DRLRDDRGRLLRTYSGGAAKLDAYLEDHAFLLEALIALFEATCEERRLEQAVALADTLIARFADERSGGFFSTAHDAEALIARRKEIEDNPMPAGASIASVGLLRLAELTGEQAYRRHADGALALVGSIAERHPRAFAAALLAVHRRLAPPRPIACPLPARPSAAGQPAAGRQ
ncbi:MAG: thioredoxin domain-containing protein, partial [Acidobacteriota bacterium]|nr:thioredoxin domain-containing protein [Acidobacteriota bacterium]